MTLAEWAARWPYPVNRHQSGRYVYVTPDSFNSDDRTAAWSLTDAIVTSVQAGAIWFTVDPRRIARRLVALHRRAWTGGNAPSGRPDPVHRAVRRLYFREQVEEWRACWGDSLDRDVRRTFWRRAHYDAHATLGRN